MSTKHHTTEKETAALATTDGNAMYKQGIGNSPAAI